ncbi:hypothetical protein GGP94_003025 [Salinibacter ruber]|uniref:DUF3987 domain-containing protein n=1 Tax=Salinibacter ruber TaxID=146919 RepID=UPI0021682D2C|nr:DUF3987 domain-containing protein [Salinibacter ruber]MCS4162580.1 hypothetical protein [Salinibacter ruber]
MIDADKLKNQLGASEHRRILDRCGFDISGERGDELDGVLGPKELGEGETGNFSVDLEQGLVMDWGSTGYEGDVLDVVQETQSLDFQEALQWIAEELDLDADALQSKNGSTNSFRSTSSMPRGDGRANGPEMPEASNGLPEPPEDPEPVVTHEQVSNWHGRLMGEGEAPRAARRYLEGRAVTEGTMKAAHVGLAHSPGDNRAEWWIMIPVPRRDLEEAPVVAVKGFGFDPEAGGWKRKDGRKIPRNAGSAALLNLVDATRDTDSAVVVCEGELDALSAYAQGFHAVSGTAGAGTFNPEWARLIAEMEPAQENGVVVAYDGDEKGRSNAPNTAETLHGAGLEPCVASLPDGKDVNDVLVEGGSTDLHAHLTGAEPYTPPEPELDVSELATEEEEGGREYEPFPLDALPNVVRAYVRAATRSLGEEMPPALVGVPTLSVLAGAVGNAAKLRLKRSWTEPATLWTAVVAPSGSTKSPAFDHGLRPIYKREAEARDAYQQELADWKAQEDPDPQDKPTRDRFRTGDATPEAVVKILEENPRGVLLARDELGAWLGSFDRYVNGAADLQFWIEVWGGIQASRDRAGEGNTTITDPVVPVTGTIQPGTLKEKLGEVHFDTGFASRLILCEPPSRPKRWTEADVSHTVRASYEKLLQLLYDTPSGMEVGLSPGAKELWIDYYNSSNASLEDRPEGPLRAVAAKGITHTARLALVLHRCRQKSGEVPTGEDSTVPVAEATMEDALRLGEWLTEETLRVYQDHQLGRETLPPVRRFLERLPERFKTSEALEIAEANDIPERTAKKWLSDLVESGDLDRIRRGHYRKV